MRIGDFNDFVATLTPEVVGQITADAQLKVEQMREDSDTNDKTWLGNQIAAISFTYALEILGFYHKWLEEQDLD